MIEPTLASVEPFPREKREVAKNVGHFKIWVLSICCFADDFYFLLVNFRKSALNLKLQRQVPDAAPSRADSSSRPRRTRQNPRRPAVEVSRELGSLEGREQKTIDIREKIERRAAQHVGKL